jgi:hypothetical protein
MTNYANRLDQLEAALEMREPINVLVWGDEDAGPKGNSAARFPDGA